MRDSERINEIIPLLKAAWNLCPDLRLGQLVTILSENKNVFYIEDDDILLGLQRFFEAKLNGQPANTEN